jgi:hypothetical protein
MNAKNVLQIEKSVVILNAQQRPLDPITPTDLLAALPRSMLIAAADSESFVSTATRV